MKDKKSILIVISAVFIIVLLFAVTFFLNHHRKSVKSNNMKYDVYTVPSQQNIFLDGEVQYLKKTSFAEDATKGTLEKINVEDKQQVKKGETLFEYKNEQMIEQYETLQQQLNGMDSQSAGQSSLQSSQINSQKSSLQQQMNDIKDKRYTTISAPFDGIVSLEKDDGNSDSKAILTLIDPKMQVVSNASEKDVLKLKANQKIKISVYGTNKEINGTIRSISTEPSQTQLPQGTGTSTNLAQSTGSDISYYPVYIDIGNQKDIYAGFHIQGTTVDENELPKIPSSSIFDSNGDKFVWLVRNKKLEKVSVEVEKYNSTYVKVKSGLDFGDKIIKSPSSEMKEGDSVGTESSGS